MAWQDPAESGQEVVDSTAVPVRPDYVRLDSWAGRLNGWTPHILSDLAAILAEAPSHGLPGQERLAEALLDPAIRLRGGPNWRGWQRCVMRDGWNTG